jgi:hypothetical protein
MKKCTCGGELVTLENDATPWVITRFCSECGQIYNFFTEQAKAEYLKKAVRTEDEKAK